MSGMVGGMPKPKAAVPVPSADDPAVIEARRLAMAEEEAKKKGRGSTQLSGTTDYSKTTLG